MEREQQKRNPSHGRADTIRENKKSEKQCAECEGFGHFKSECPTLKKKGVKCYECKGYGHSKVDCLAMSKSKQSSYDTDEDERDRDELINNFGVIEENKKMITREVQATKNQKFDLNQKMIRMDYLLMKPRY